MPWQEKKRCIKRAPSEKTCGEPEGGAIVDRVPATLDHSILL